MQIKTTQTSLALGAAIALLLGCSEGNAETTNTADQAASNMISETQDGLPAPADVAAAPADASVTSSGLAYKMQKAGTGSEHPSAADEVTVHYTGWTTDGKMFDSSVQRGRPSSFPLNGVIAGWTEGLQLMVEGETTRFWIPENLAYQGTPGKPAGMLVFDVELIKIKSKPKAPANLNAPPAEATTTSTGLKYLSLKAGTGSEHPGAADMVKVHYSGWTTDGQLFDSSVERDEPASFPLGGVIAGWTEGLQLMVVGEKARLWVPEELAYKGQQGAPAGLLVFDVELLSITKAPKVPENLKTPPADAVTTESGLIVHTMKAGDPAATAAGARVALVHFSFWDQEGKMYQSSRMTGTPVPMDLESTPIPGLTEALGLLSLGESARVWVPEALGFNGQRGAPAGILVFDIEVLRFFHAPPHLEEAPAEATKTDSGLAYMVLEASQDAEAKLPTDSSKVEMHYSGWSSEGKLFDSSYFQGKPSTFTVSAVMPGWTEGLKLMKAGDRFRFWIPQALGMGARQGAPQGDLVFDIELISVK